MHVEFGSFKASHQHFMDRNKIEVLTQIMKVREQVPLFSLRVMLDVMTLLIAFIPRVLKRDSVVLCI